MFTDILKILALSAVMLPIARGAELTHSFVNPDFGGSPFNYSNLMSGATAQNKFKAPTTTGSAASAAAASKAKTSADLFAEQFNALLLNRLANRLVDQAVGGTSGSTTPQDTVFNTGVNTIMLEGGAGSTSTRVTIIDNATGNRTVLDVPNL
jgi:curli production assembly/transport component CsgF